MMLETKLEVFTSKKDGKKYYVLNTYYTVDDYTFKVCSYFLKDGDKVAMRELVKQVESE